MGQEISPVRSGRTVPVRAWNPRGASRNGRIRPTACRSGRHSGRRGSGSPRQARSRTWSLPQPTRRPTVNRYTVALRQRTTARPLDAARIAVVPGPQGSHHATVKGRCAIGPGYPSDPIQDELGKCLTAEWCAVEYAGDMRVRDHTGAELDTTLSVEIQPDGNPSIVFECRSGLAGQRAGRNTAFRRGLQLILERLFVAGFTINAVFLDTTVPRRMGLSEDERRIPILPNTWPITPATGVLPVDLAGARVTGWRQLRQDARGMVPAISQGASG